MGAGARPADAGLSRSGAHRPDHDPEFRVAVVLPDRAGRRQRPSKRAAEQAAAAAMLTREASSPNGAMAEVHAAPAEPTTRCGFVALIGAPNVGKSTLANALVGAKVTIVTPKVQTTRTLMRGIAIEGEAQLIFVDTPGIFSPRRRLDRAMVATAWGATHDADIVALLIDAHKGLHEEDEAILRTLGDVRSAKMLVLNKVDLVEKPALLTLTQTPTNAWPSPRPS